MIKRDAPLEPGRTCLTSAPQALDRTPNSGCRGDDAFSPSFPGKDLRPCHAVAPSGCGIGRRTMRPIRPICPIIPIFHFYFLINFSLHSIRKISKSVTYGNAMCGFQAVSKWANCKGARPALTLNHTINKWLSILR